MPDFLDVDIPEPNPALAALFVSPRMAEIVGAAAETAKTLYQAQVAKRTGALAASAQAHVEIGGKHHDRFIGELVVGWGLDYGAAHEFGVGIHPNSVHQLDAGSDRISHGAHDLNRVLEELSGS